MIRQLRWLWALVFCAFLLVGRTLFAQTYDPPAGYYATATDTGAALKQQLHDIIDDHTVRSYGDARAFLQNTDQDPNDPDHILLVYDRVSLDVSTINPGGPIPGWDGSSWDREHTWPKSRGVGESGADTSDLHHLRPSTRSVNSNRGNLNFGGAYGAQPFEQINDGAGIVWYPGDADAGMIARAEFYMAVRYDGSDLGTTDLEVGVANVADVTGDSDPPPQLGDLHRMIEWHFAAPPDDFERRRNQVVYGYQLNRNSFIDRPEFAWSVFVDQMNDSRIVIGGATVGGDGGSTLDLDYGRIFVGGPLPAMETVTLDKLGEDGTYFEVSTAGNVTSSLAGRYNAFRTGTTDSKTINVGLDASTATAGLRSGTVTIDNLDVTTGGGAGRGANDASDTINLNLEVVDHATASFDSFMLVKSLEFDFGAVALGGPAPVFQFDVFNLEQTSGFTAGLDFDSYLAFGDAGAFSTDFDLFAGALSIDSGMSHTFTASLDTAAEGAFAATYTLMLSDEDLEGTLTHALTLTLIGEVVASIVPGDYNADGTVSAADYTIWQDTLGANVAAFTGADGDGSGIIDASDYLVWKGHFGESVAGHGSAAAATVPAPQSSTVLMATAAALTAVGRRRLK